MVEFGTKSESPSAGCFSSSHVVAPSRQCERLKHAIPEGFICAVVLSMYEKEKTQKGTQLNSLDMALFLYYLIMTKGSRPRINMQ